MNFVSSQTAGISHTTQPLTKGLQNYLEPSCTVTKTAPELDFIHNILRDLWVTGQNRISEYSGIFYLSLSQQKCVCMHDMHIHAHKHKNSLLY